MLGSDWIGRWNRSHAKFPAEVSADQRLAFEQQILQHEQFR
jgi:hypothetical protein